MSYWACFYHLVWATRRREPILDPSKFGLVEAVVRSALAEGRVMIHAVGCMPDHVHDAASLLTALAIAEVVKRWKGSSSHLINAHRGGSDGRFGWRTEYGVHTFGREALPRVVAYVEHQREHHHLGELWPGLERTTSAPPTNWSPEGNSLA